MAMQELQSAVLRTEDARHAQRHRGDIVAPGDFRLTARSRECRRGPPLGISGSSRTRSLCRRDSWTQPAVRPPRSDAGRGRVGRTDLRGWRRRDRVQLEETRRDSPSRSDLGSMACFNRSVKTLSCCHRLPPRCPADSGEAIAPRQTSSRTFRAIGLGRGAITRTHKQTTPSATKRSPRRHRSVA